MPERNEPLLDAPIPGMSMTHEVGARPWQQPSKYNTVEEASRYYITRMQDKNFTDMLINVLEMGVPVTTLANTIQLSSVMQGLHNIDVGMLVLPVIMETIILTADTAGIEYNTGLDKDDTVAIDSKNSEILSTIGKLGDLVEEEEEDEDMEMPVEEELMEEPQMGIMARR
tara:strand:+ start:122 stop:631 length:510 start_codon:yes stop_codon:yes gene_type:complete